MILTWDRNRQCVVKLYIYINYFLFITIWKIGNFTIANYRTHFININRHKWKIKTTEVDHNWTRWVFWILTRHNYKHFMKNKQRIVHMLCKNRKCEFLRKNNHCCGSLRPLMQHMHGVISTCKALKK